MFKKMFYKNMKNNCEALSAKAIGKKNCTEFYAAIVKITYTLVRNESNQTTWDNITLNTPPIEKQNFTCIIHL